MTTFEALGLEDVLLKAVNELGFSTPTPIQSKAIPVLLSGTRDFVGLAQTGTGKTAAFGLPLLQLIDEENKFPQALIICPTRELCVQINDDLQEFKKYKKGIHSVAVYGGSSISTQIREIRRGVQVVVATPGRLIDLINRKTIDLTRVKYLVLDEADEMLNMGFREDVDFVLHNTPGRDSAWLFSATMPSEVRSIADKFMTSPKEVTIGKKNAANTDIEHKYFLTSAQHRFEVLKRLIDSTPDIYGLIFTRTKAGAQEVADKLASEKYAVEAIHGDLSQQQRDRVMNHFRNHDIQLLVATDVAARGIDVEGISHVINYELPDDPEVYTHRSGRTGRAGKKGICLSICHVKELYRIRQIESLIKAPLQKSRIPSGAEVCQKKMEHFLDKLMATDIEAGSGNIISDEAVEKFESWSKEDLIKKIVLLEMNQLLEYYRDAADLNAKASKDVRTKNNERQRMHRPDKTSNHYSRLFINLGSKDGFYKSSLLQYLLEESDLKKASIGRIDMKELNTWVEVGEKDAKKMINKLDGKKFKNRILRMNRARF